VANDSIKLLGKAVKAKLNLFEDDNLLLNIDGVVQGEVQEVTPATKEKEVQLSKRNGIASFGGWRNTQTITPAAKANLLFQNKKSDFKVMIPTKQFG
jgi:hypothetical protein